MSTAFANPRRSHTTSPHTNTREENEQEHDISFSAEDVRRFKHPIDSPNSRHSGRARIADSTERKEHTTDIHTCTQRGVVRESDSTHKSQTTPNTDKANEPKHARGAVTPRSKLSNTRQALSLYLRRNTVHQTAPNSRCWRNAAALNGRAAGVGSTAARALIGRPPFTR